MNAEFLTYSRSKGLFAGLDLDGTVLEQNKDDIWLSTAVRFPLNPFSSGSVPVPPNATRFVSTVARYFVIAKSR